MTQEEIATVEHMVEQMLQLELAAKELQTGREENRDYYRGLEQGIKDSIFLVQLAFSEIEGLQYLQNLPE